MTFSGYIKTEVHRVIFAHKLIRKIQVLTGQLL